MKIINTDVYMTRGDSESFTVSCQKANGAKVDFVEGDTLYFTVKYSVNNEKKEFQKVITDFVDGGAIIEIKPEDTKDMSFRKYVYDIQLTRADGTVTTIITPSAFVVEEEVTYE